MRSLGDRRQLDFRWLWRLGESKEDGIGCILSAMAPLPPPSRGSPSVFAEKVTGLHHINVLSQPISDSDTTIDEPLPPGTVDHRRIVGANWLPTADSEPQRISRQPHLVSWGYPLPGDCQFWATGGVRLPPPIEATSTALDEKTCPVPNP